MKKTAILAALTTALLCSCSKPDVQGGTDEGQAVVFAVSLGATRAAQNYPLDDYFRLGADYEKVTVEYGGIPYTYIYNIEEGVLSAFSPTDVLRFPQSGRPMDKIVMRWPEDGAAGEGGVVKDQSRLVDFLSMDRLEGSVQNVVPTTIIPIVLDHARSKVTFTLEGLHAGKRITSLTAGDYTAYCDPAINDAQLIFDPVADKGTLLMGTVIKFRIEGETGDRIFSLQDSPEELPEGTTGNFTVTLSPKE